MYPERHIDHAAVSAGQHSRLLCSTNANTWGFFKYLSNTSSPLIPGSACVPDLSQPSADSVKVQRHHGLLSAEELTVIQRSMSTATSCRCQAQSNMPAHQQSVRSEWVNLPRMSMQVVYLDSSGRERDRVAGVSPEGRLEGCVERVAHPVAGSLVPCGRVRHCGGCPAAAAPWQDPQGANHPQGQCACL